MKKILAVAFIATSFPVMALGPTVCKMGKVERTIEIVYKTPGATVPCDVKYTKEGGEEKVIYSAQAKEGYCEEKATEFAGKLSERGFACSQAGAKTGEEPAASAPAAPTAPAPAK